MSKTNRKPIQEIRDPQSADTVGVQRFAQAMVLKMAKKRAEGKRGWNTTRDSGWGCSVQELEVMLRKHLAKGDLVDVANFCMMVWNRRNPKGT